MPLQVGQLLDWTDIQAIYTNLNIAKQKFSQTQVSIPANEGKAVLTTHLSTLVSQIEAMSSLDKIGSAANVGVTIPSRGDLITPFEFSRAAQVAETIAGICNHNVHFADYHDFTDFSDFSDDSPDFTDFGDDSPDNSDGDNFDFCFTFTSNSFDTAFRDFCRNIVSDSDF